jgi:dTDP-4-amino-4,6-dideoxygalactose transaminase
VALASLAEVERHVNRRNELVDRIEAHLGQLPGVRIIPPAQGDRSTFKDLTLVLDGDLFGLNAEELQRALAADQIDSRRYYSPPIHRQQAYLSTWRERRDLPCTDDLAGRVLSPPMWSHLSDDQADRLCGAISRIHDHAPSVRGALGDSK